jgi:hypothetical protein
MTRLVLIASLLFLPAIVHADGEAVRDGSEQQTRYDFEDHVIPGDYPVPLEDFVHARKRQSRSGLVQVRETFVPELVKSVEDL